MGCMIVYGLTHYGAIFHHFQIFFCRNQKGIGHITENRNPIGFIWSVKKVNGLSESAHFLGRYIGPVAFFAKTAGPIYRPYGTKRFNTITVYMVLIYKFLL